MKSVASLLVAALLCGCAHGPREAGFDPYHRTVRFESEPSGARVFVAYGSGVGAVRSREYLGTTPCTNIVPCASDGTFGGQGGIAGVSVFVPRIAVFTAELGTNVTKQTLRSGALAQSPDRVPAAMFFDFAKP
jgi:hypothetical protein